MIKDYRNNPCKSAFSWAEGKSKIAEFPKYKTYVEVFVGVLSVIYRKERLQIEIVKDIYEKLSICILLCLYTLKFYLNEMLILRDVFSLLKKQNCYFVWQRGRG
ncbi:MAG: hypothetical protein LBD84_07140 [Campylobacteraceae bacterium]|jgi:site-specific DNA-adenine methylase|nr:hypothetical protein [Campylobacteraceae bacterium]